MQKTSRFSRLMAVLLAVFMAVCCLPLSAFAEGDESTGESTKGTVTVQLWDVDTNEMVTNFDVELTIGESYTLERMAEIKGYALPVDYKETAPQSHTITGEGLVLNINVKNIAKPEEPEEPVEPEQPTTAQVTVQLWDVDTNKMITDFKATLNIGQSYTLDEMAAAAGYVLPVDYEETAPISHTITGEGLVLNINVKNIAEPVEPEEKVYITYKVIDSETREQIATWQVLEGDPLSSYSGTVPKKDGYTLDYLTFIDADKPVDMANTVAVKNLNGGLEWTLEAHFKALPAGYEDVNVRFEFVDMDSKTVLPALNYATTVSDDVIGPKVADVFADMTKQLAEKNYAFHHMTLVYEDGSESSALKDPVIVPDYDGATIKVYFNKVSSGNGGNTSSGNSNNNSSNSNTTTVTATNDNGETVVKAAAAPANNSAKILPQTGVAEQTPVAFGVMMFAALAGAAAYLFAIRKKLN